MEKQTALMQLKEKLQKVVDEIGNTTSAREFGYREACESIIKDINAQMLAIEKQQIVDAHYHGQDYTEGDPVYSAAEQYFESTYKTNEQ